MDLGFTCEMTRQLSPVRFCVWSVHMLAASEFTCEMVATPAASQFTCEMTRRVTGQTKGPAVAGPIC